MATRSTIAVQHEDGTISQIYCHWNGYLEYNGAMLLTHYNTQERAEELVSLGELSVLEKLLHPKTDTHTFDSPEPDVCIFYGRDRGEDNTSPIKYKNYKHYKHENNGWQEYNYLFKNGAWYYSSIYTKTDRLRKIPAKYATIFAPA